MAPKRARKVTQEGANVSAARERMSERTAGKSSVTKPRSTNEPKPRSTSRKNATRAGTNDQPDQISEGSASEAADEPLVQEGPTAATKATSSPKRGKKKASPEPKADNVVSLKTYWRLYSLNRHLELHLDELEDETQGLKSNEVKKAYRHLELAVHHLENVAPKGGPPEEKQVDGTEEQHNNETDEDADALNYLIENIADVD